MELTFFVFQWKYLFFLRYVDSTEIEFPEVPRKGEHIALRKEKTLFYYVVTNVIWITGKDTNIFIEIRPLSIFEKFFYFVVYGADYFGFEPFKLIT